MKINVGESYKINGSSAIVEIIDRIGDLYIGKCGNHGSRYVFKHDGTMVSGYNAYEHFGADDDRAKKWNLVLNEPHVYVKLIFSDASVSEFFRIKSTREATGPIVAGFIKIDGNTSYYNTSDSLDDALEDVLEY